MAVVIIAAAFVALGFWQLGRLQEKQLTNQIGQARFDEVPIPLGTAVDAAGEDVETLEYRRATATGTFDPGNEVLVRSQTFLGTAGFHVITPLVGEDGSAVLVNRGWVPLVLDQVPVVDAPPPEGVVTVEGWIHLTQTRGPFGPSDPEDVDLTAISRVDVDRVAQQTPYPLEPVYLVVLGEPGQDLPVPAAPPTFDDEGPHLGYAIQWFAFAIIGLIGYGFLMRRTTSRSS